VRISQLTFDIIWFPGWMIEGSRVGEGRTVAANVEAIDRSQALLSWVSRELGVRIDPLDMFRDDPFQLYERPCGCESELWFRTERLPWRLRRRLGVEAAPLGLVDFEPCDDHFKDVQDMREGSDWQGTLAAWRHDPRRPERFQVPHPDNWDSEAWSSYVPMCAAYEAWDAKARFPRASRLIGRLLDHGTALLGGAAFLVGPIAVVVWLAEWWF
jgi:hypothetical protein